MKSHFYGILLVCCVIISCENPEIPAETYFSAGDNTIEQEEIVREITMQKIPEMKGYLFVNGHLRGIRNNSAVRDLDQIKPKAIIDGKEVVVQLDEFFSAGDTLYFSFTDRYKENEEDTELTEERCFFSQKNGEVSEIEKLPAKPAPGIGSDYGPFSFNPYKWEGEDFIRLIRVDDDYIIAAAKNFDSAVLTSEGLYYNQREKMSREAGLYYFGNKQFGGPIRLSDPATIW